MGGMGNAAGSMPPFPFPNQSSSQQPSGNSPQSFSFAPPPVQGDPREVYRQQLQEMREMGFPSEEANLIALQQAQGNVSFAVDRLLNSQ